MLPRSLKETMTILLLCQEEHGYLVTMSYSLQHSLDAILDGSLC